MPKDATTERTMFSAGDMVTWRTEAETDLRWLAEQKDEHGDGPFRVARVMKLDAKSCQLYPADAHPQQVFVEVPDQKEPVRFSGNWFEKVACVSTDSRTPADVDDDAVT